MTPTRRFGKGGNIMESLNVEKTDIFPEEIKVTEVVAIHNRKVVLVEGKAADFVGLSGSTKRDIVAIIDITTSWNIEEDRDIGTTSSEVTSAYGVATAYNAIQIRREST